jgi:hypothetical protein
MIFLWLALHHAGGRDSDRIAERQKRKVIMRSMGRLAHFARGAAYLGRDIASAPNV